MSVAPATGRRPPGPRGKPLVGSILDFRRDILRALLDGWHEYGDLVEFNVAGASYLVVHPDYIQHILRDNESNYPHAPFLDARWAKIVGNGLVTSKGDFWARQRRLADPSFHQDRIAEFGQIMTETTQEMLENWKPFAERGEPIDVREQMMRLTITILSKAMFSADIWEKTDTISRVVGVLLTHASNRLFSPVDVPEQVPLPSHRRYIAARDEFDELIYGIIAERRREPRSDLLSMFIAARDEETGENMSDEQVRDEVRTMFIAGHETTATSLAWTWYLLSMHPNVAQRLRAELDDVLGGRPPTSGDLPQLTYTWRVIQESLRLYPPIWMYLRTAIEDDVVGGYKIRAGKNIYLSPYITQRHLDFWDNPEGFDPDRFAPEKTQGWHRFKYWPFGGGPRKCIGNNFAVVEMQLVVATVAQMYDLVLAPGHQVVIQPGLSLRQRDGVLVNLEQPRHAGTPSEPAELTTTA
jgi:enediyne biosynthesis protein E7